MEDFLKPKLTGPDSFSSDLIKAVDLITYKKQNLIFAGSAFLKSMRYSSDIDLAEYFGKTYSSQDIAHALQTIVSKIQNAKGEYYLGDVKAGLDDDLNVFESLGEIRHQRVRGYSPAETYQQLNSIKQLISKEDYREISELIPLAAHSISDWFDLREAIRKLMTLRWEPAEIQRGYKVIRGNKIYLSEAVVSFMTKIDMWFNYNGVFTEITNVLMSYLNEQEGLVFLPISAKKEFAEDAIKYNLFEFMHHKDKNYLKAMKRLFTLAKMKHDSKTLNQVFPLLVSDIGLLNKVGAILSTLKDMIEKLKNPPMKAIQANIDHLKAMVANIYQFPFGEKRLVEELTELMHTSKNQLMNRLEDLIERIHHIVNQQTLKYMHDHKIKVDSIYLP